MSASFESRDMTGYALVTVNGREYGVPVEVAAELERLKC